MNSALIERPAATTPAVTSEQLELVKRTVAAGATDAELKLFLFDCARQGVHPLDKLIHFTKRGGKYTPITSIDFMRIRAAETNEYAGSDDATFSVCEHCGGENIPGPDVVTFAARVTVWRLVQGQRCAFTATARWSEYCPAAGQDHMWKKMPHTMLAKCAEALALRKGFPRQLAGLYAKEEMDRAGNGNGGYTVTAPADPPVTMASGAMPTLAPVVPAAQPLSADPRDFATTQNTAPRPELPPGTVRIERVDTNLTKNKNVRKYFVTLSSGEVVTTIKEQLGALCEQLAQENLPVTVETKKTQWGTDLVSVHRIPAPEFAPVEPTGQALHGDEIPF